jgi:H+/Cl- antiporter ClcA
MSAVLRRYGTLAVLAALSGLLAGLGGWVFLVVLDAVTEVRLGQQWLVLGLPIAGVVTLVIVRRISESGSAGNAAVFRQLDRIDEGIPTTLAPIVVVGTWITHLFGGSAGREGTALQMSAALTDTMSRRLRVSENDRRLLLGVALAAGFGAVFGTPLAGAVFAIEAHSRWRMRWSILVPSIVAAFVGDAVVRVLGYGHAATPVVSLGLDPSTLAACVVLGLGAGIVATAYVRAARGVRWVLARWVGSPTMRIAIGGCVIIALTAAFGAESLGLSTQLADRALAGDALNPSVSLLKLVFTAVTAGSGFIGGEVTPLFVMGATFGSAGASLLGLPVAAAAAFGFVAVFGAAAHVPLACAVMALELFGVDALPHALVVCIVASLIARHPGLHPISAPKNRT